MRNLEFDAYVKDTLNLVKTMVIKIDEIGVRDNKVLERAGFEVNYNDRRTWRYYLNLNGEYHITDTPMYIKSIDTGEMILFSKENLEVHLSTKRIYSDANSYQYRRLIEAYPAQFLLINSILNPISMDESINARNYKILRYNKSLVLWNEEQLIPELQKAIDAFVFKAFHNGYMETDNLMLPQLIAQLYGRLPGDIMNIRMEAVGTRYVHEFHIWSKINSYFNINQYKDSLDTHQKMWLYRNINWIVKNIGTQWSFNKLIENLLTHRRIPLASFIASKDTEKQSSSLKPTPIFFKRNKNLLNLYGISDKVYSVKDIINKELPLAKDNPLLADIGEEEVTYKLTTSLHSELPTKLLESEMEDYSDRETDSLIKTLLCHWFYLAGMDVYQTVIELEEPKTGKVIKLDVPQSAVLFDYLLATVRGEKRTNILWLYYQRVMKVLRPTFKQIDNFILEPYKNDKLVRSILEQSTDFPKIINPEAFFNKCKEIYNLKWNHTKIYSQYYDHLEYSEVKQACDFMYQSGFTKLTDFKTYQSLLEYLEIDINEYTVGEMEDLAIILFNKVTGWELNSTNSLRDTQKALLRLTSELSSYTVQLLNTMRDGSDTLEFEGRFSLTPNSSTASVNDPNKCSLYTLPTILPDFKLYKEFEIPFIGNDELIATIGGEGILELHFPYELEEVDGRDSEEINWNINLELSLEEALSDAV